ncbi:WecB/TagA/CpsF family glycosyltransferase [Methylobacterium organophilum]|uniref:WecB/TagA/CpsF family glycosyltransferase n=1 Tax=Methylobacterium organophilum TaxID=410 RepID=UPI003B845F36
MSLMESAAAPGAALMRAVPVTRLGGVAIAAADMAETVALMIEAARLPRGERPLFLTSANGEVLSRCARDPDFAQLVEAADLINPDGQPMVVLSRWFGSRRLPERVATTDLFHHVARAAIPHDVSFYLYGATEEENRRALANVRKLYPDLRLLGGSHGFHRGAALEAKLAEIDALAPDILWLGLGVPREQHFVQEHGARLSRVGMIKTSGGLFNFLSGTRSRAPAWIQRVGFEWAWRLGQEPARLTIRYTLTNPHAVALLVGSGLRAQAVRVAARMQAGRGAGNSPRALAQNGE